VCVFNPLRYRLGGFAKRGTDGRTTRSAPWKIGHRSDEV
jgi:hypothetical protein